MDGDEGEVGEWGKKEGKRSFLPTSHPWGIIEAATQVKSLGNFLYLVVAVG